MAQGNDIHNTRGQKETVNGLVVDQQGVHLDLEAVQKKVINAANDGPMTKEAEEGSSDDGPAIDGEHDLIEGKLIDKNGFHLDKDDLLSSIASTMKMSPIKTSKNKGKGTEKSASVDLGMYQPVWEELQQIPFSDNYEQEMLVIAKAVKEVSKELKVKRIIANTQALAKNAQKFYYSDNGMRVIFSILGNKFSMAAKGEFTGMEAFYIQVNGDSLDGVVLRKNDNGDYKDVTEGYTIEIKRA